MSAFTPPDGGSDSEAVTTELPRRPMRLSSKSFLSISILLRYFRSRVEGILLRTIHPVKRKHRSTFSALHNRSQVSYLEDSRSRSSTLADVLRSFSTATLFWS